MATKEKCKHTLCTRDATKNNNGYCSECMQMEHITEECNYCLKNSQETTI